MKEKAGKAIEKVIEKTAQAKGGREEKTQQIKKRVVLLDMHAILHRSYHALQQGFTSPITGEPTNALYGFATLFFKMLDELHPHCVIACYDLPAPTHRHEAFADYKGTRKKTDEELVSQIVRSKELLDAFAIPRLEKEGFEADDLLGTLATHYKHLPETEVVIVSGDMDTLQLVDGDVVRVYTLKRGMNDTALYNEDAVLQRYGFPPTHLPDFKGLRGDPSDNIPGIQGIGEKTATTLMSHFDNLDALFATLAKDETQVRALGITPRIVSLLKEGEDEARFSKELATITCDVDVDMPPCDAWESALLPERAIAMCNELGFRSIVSRLRTRFAVEASGGEDAHPALSKEEEQEALLALYLVHSDITHPTMEELCEYTNTRQPRIARERILQEIQEKDIEQVLRTIELPLVPVVEKMEQWGILLDTAYLNTLSREYHTELDALAEQVYASAGTQFNINSPKQLGEVLFNTLGIGGGKGKKTATGQRSTREDELKKYAAEHEIVAQVLEYREVQKLLSTYIDPLPNMVDAQSRLHAQFLQTGTTTGRMSSQNPNMQNIPIKTARGSKIRNAVIAPQGSVLVAADYSQIELRIAAIIARDATLAALFKEGKDVHTAVAAQVFAVEENEVTSDMRRKAKAINFGILYGMGARALGEATGTSQKEAAHYLEQYFARFTGIAAYVEDIKAQVYKHGYTTTLFGRRRYFEGARSPLPHIRAQAERMALNAPIQGTQADIIKTAMVQIDTLLTKKSLQGSVHLISQIHDELMYEVAEGVMGAVIALIQDTMESVLTKEQSHGVPLKVDVKVGKKWGDMESHS
jgi:DNA polymerase I